MTTPLAPSVMCYRWYVVSGSGTTADPYRLGPRTPSGANDDSTLIPFQNLVAKCSKGYDHEAPAKDCSCGIYAIQGDLSQLAQYRATDAAFAVIELGGSTLGGTNGVYRGQTATLRALVRMPTAFRLFMEQEGRNPVSDLVLAQIAAEYGVQLLDPEEAANDPEALRERLRHDWDQGLADLIG